MKKYGFEVVDTTDNGYELLALSWDGAKPQFTPGAKSSTIDSPELTIYYDNQCPYIYKSVEAIKEYCATEGVPLSLKLVDRHRTSARR